MNSPGSAHGSALSKYTMWNSGKCDHLLTLRLNKQVHDQMLQCVSKTPKTQFLFIISSLSVLRERKNKIPHFFCHIVYHKSMNFRWRSYTWKRNQKSSVVGKTYLCIFH